MGSLSSPLVAVLLIATGTHCLTEESGRAFFNPEGFTRGFIGVDRLNTGYMGSNGVPIWSFRAPEEKVRMRSLSPYFMSRNSNSYVDFVDNDLKSFDAKRTGKNILLDVGDYVATKNGNDQGRMAGLLKNSG